MISLPRLRCSFLVVFGLILSFLSQSRAGIVAIGTDVGGQALVKLYDTPATTPFRSFVAYPPTFNNGVRVAVGDVNGDGTQDVITVPGAGIGAEVRAFDTSTGASLFTPFVAFDPVMTAGAYVAAGDIDGDGTADIIVGSGEGSSTATRVRIYRGSNRTLLADFLPYGAAYSGGVRVAVGDVNGDGVPDIITGTGSDRANVKVFHGRTRTEIASFLAIGSPNFSDGVYVASGDVNGDGYADIITGAGPGAGSQVKVFSGQTLGTLRSFFAYEGGFNGGVRVAAGDVNGDGRADFVTAPGPTRNALIKTFNGRTGALVAQFLANEPTFTSGVFAGGISIPPVQAITNPATSITATTATLNGFVNPNGRTVTVQFQYGLTLNYGTTVNAVPNTVSSPTNVIANLTGLLPGKTYHFRVVATDGLGGTVVGADRTFSTDTNKLPTGGTFTITPPSPVTAGTVLTATFAGWTDPDGHTPLRYEVREGTTIIVVRTEDPTPQFILPAGTHQLIGRVYDTLGGFTETGPVEVVVTGDPDSELLFVTRDPVPGTGGGGTDPDVWSSFGIPAIADASVKFLGNFVGPSGRGGGVFSNGTPVALIGDPVPGAGAGGTFAIPTEAVFKSFKDPVTDPSGHVAFIATMTGVGVTAANDTVVVSNGRTGTLEVIAREGFDAPGAAGTRFSAFLSVSIDGTGVGGTIFTARLAGARPADNSGAWWLPAGSTSTMLLVRRGDPGVAAAETIRTFSLHQALPGTMGQGRGQVDASEAVLQAVMNTGRQAILRATPGALTPLAVTGDPITGGSVWIRTGLPSTSDDGQFLSVRGSFRPPGAPASSPGVVGILRSSDSGATWSVFAGVGDEAEGTDATWVDLGFPVNSPTDSGLAFLGRVRGGASRTTDDQGVWWRNGAGEVKLLAQEGKQAVGCAAGVTFRAFRSLAYPTAEGPIFVATVGGPGVNASNDVGVWVVDASGSLRLLFREGQKIGTRTIVNFAFLGAVAGSPGVTRGFNTVGEVAWRALFNDRSLGIVVSQIR